MWVKLFNQAAFIVALSVSMQLSALTEGYKVMGGHNSPSFFIHHAQLGHEHLTEFPDGREGAPIGYPWDAETNGDVIVGTRDVARIPESANQGFQGYVLKQSLGWGGGIHAKAIFSDVNINNLEEEFAVYSEDSNKPQGKVIAHGIASLSPTFSIYNAEGAIVALSTPNFLMTKYTLTDPMDNHVLAVLSKAHVRGSSFDYQTDWMFNIYDSAINENNIRPHMLVLLTPIQLDLKYWQKTYIKDQLNEVGLLMETLREKLGQRRDEINIELIPSKEDYEAIESLSEQKAAIFNDLDEKDRVLQTIDALIEVLDFGRLPVRQKVALFMLLMHRLEQ